MEGRELPNTARKNFNCLDAAPEYVSKLRKESVNASQVYSQAKRLPPSTSKALISFNALISVW
jgi:hypothetical protein